MEITTRSLWTLVHGMGFGALYLLACSGAIIELCRHYGQTEGAPVTGKNETFLRVNFVTMTLLA